MRSNDITTVRMHLLNFLSEVCDANKPIDKERVIAVCNIAQAIVDTAKVEVEYIRATDYIGTGFLECDESLKDARNRGELKKIENR